MAVQAVFQADFTSFDAGVKKAEAGLISFGTTTVNVEKALQEMTQAAASGTAPTQSLTSAYKQFDGVLAAVGVRMAPQIAAVGELHTAALGLAAGFGALGVAAGGAVAVFTAWTFREQLAELTGMNTLILSLAQSLGLIEDVRLETTAAQLDTINRALAEGARHGLSYAQSIQFIQDKHTDWNAKLSDAQREVRNLSAAEERGIDIMQRAGAGFDAIHARYGISELALKELAARKKITTDQSAAHTAALEKEAEAAKKTAEETAKISREIANEGELWTKRQRAMLDNAAAEALADQHVQELAKSRAEAAAQTAALTEQEQMLEAEYQKTVEAATAMSAAHTEAGVAAVQATQATVVGYQAVSQQLAKTTEEARARIAIMQYTAAANAIYARNSLYTSPGQLEQVANLPLPSALAGGIGSGSSAPVVNITMNGMLGANDPQTKAAITQVVGDALAESMRGQRLLSSA